MADKLRIVEYTEVKPFVNPDRWDEFVSVLYSGPSEGVDRLKIIEAVAGCVAEVFNTTPEILKGSKGSRDESDARICFTYILLNIGMTEAWVAEHFGRSKGTVAYRKTRFTDLYETDAFFNRRVHALVSDMHEKGFLFVKI